MARISLAPAPVRDTPPPPSRSANDLRTVSLWRILRRDNAAFLLASFGTVLFGYALLVWITGHSFGGRGRPARAVPAEEALGFTAVTGALMVTLWAIAGLRALWIRRLFHVGEPVQATVEKVSHAKGYSRVRLGYRHRGTQCSLRRSIRRSARARTLAPGDSVAILVDPERSRRIVVAELFDGG